MENIELAGIGNKIGLDRLLRIAKQHRPEKPIDFSEWVVRYTRLRDQSFSFKRHEYQKQIIDDTHPRQAIKKSVQLGISEILIRKLIAFLCQYQGTQAIYTFPTADEVGQFVKTRIDTAITDCTKVKELGFNVDNVKIKQIGKSFAHFRGSFGERETIAVPSDFNIHDEINFSKPDIQNLYRSRLEHSAIAWEINCSTPSIPQYAIDEMFESSDQNYWHIKCNHCNEWQVLQWFPEEEKRELCNIVKKDEEYIFICKKCHKEIWYDPNEIKMQWVTKYPERKDIRGYALNALIGWGYKTAGQIIKSFNDYKEVDKAYNRILGLAYSDPGKKLSRNDIFKCMNNNLVIQETGRNCFLGADQASPPRVIIGNYDPEKSRVRIVYFEEVKGELFDHPEKKGRLSKLMEDYDVLTAVIDAQPNTESAEQFAKKYPGKVWLCYYSDKLMQKLLWKPEEFTVVVNRNRTLDTAMQYWIDKRVEIFPEDNYNYKTYEEFIRHLTSLTKVIDEDKDGRQYSRWLTPKKTDFAHVWNYFCMSLETEGEIINRVMELKISGLGIK